MAIHGLTRVECRGSRTVVVAGPIPPSIAVKGLVQEVTATPVVTPMTKLRTVAKAPNAPARFEVPPRTVKPQAEAHKETESGK